MYTIQKYGEANSISNLIQILDWGESIDAGYTFSFIIQGTYESTNTTNESEASV